MRDNSFICHLKCVSLGKVLNNIAVCWAQQQKVLKDHNSF